MVKVANRGRRCHGQGIVEGTCGMLLIIILGLFMTDIFAIAAGASVNDELVKRAARAAAGQPSLAAATTAVNTIQSQFPVAGIVSHIDPVTIANFDPSHGGGVRVRSRLTVTLPIPVPFNSDLSVISLQAEDQEDADQ